MELGKSNHFSWLLLWFLMPKLMPITYCFKQKAQGLNRPAPSNLDPSYIYFSSVWNFCIGYRYIIITINGISWSVNHKNYWKRWTWFDFLWKLLSETIKQWVLFLKIKSVQLFLKSKKKKWKKWKMKRQNGPHRRPHGNKIRHSPLM